MEGKERLTQWLRRLTAYKYVLLVIAAGLVLLLLPHSEADGDQAQRQESDGTDRSVAELEDKLAETLTHIRGAGRVSVVLTVDGGTERTYASNRTQSQEEREEEILVISRGSGVEEAVVKQERYPVYRGALVVCEGGEDPEVCLEITRAVAVLTGLGADRISVCKGF